MGQALARRGAGRLGIPGDLRRLTRSQREVIVRRHVAGETLEELVGYAGLGMQQLRRLFRQRRVIEMVSEESGGPTASAQRARMRLGLLQDRAVDTQEELLGSDSEEMRYKASRFILESILPREVHAQGQLDVRHHVDAAVVVKATETMDHVLTLLREQGGEGVQRYTLHGTEGLESAIAEEETPCLQKAASLGPGLAHLEGNVTGDERTH